MRRALAVALLALAVASAPFTASAVLAGEYEIGNGDVLKVTVIGQAEMTGNFTVDAEGMVHFPILGKVKASEMVPSELERKLTTLLANGYLRRPQVSVSVAEYGSQKVFVAGEVQKPGPYALKADRSLLTLLGDIGALGPDVGHEVIVVRPPAAGAGEQQAATPGDQASALGPEFPAEANRTVDSGASKPDAGASQSDAGASKDRSKDAKAGADKAADGKSDGKEDKETPPPSPVPGLPFVAPGSEIFHVSLLELQSGNPARNITLHAGDTVFFPKAAHVYVLGSVSRPGPYKFEEGMTVLQALTLAGGVTDRGSEGRTKVVRIVAGKKVEHKVKATDLVEPEDTLMVPERFF